MYLEQRKFALSWQPEKNFLATKKNIFGSNNYFFILETFFLNLKIYFFIKLKILFFDSNEIFLIAKTFSLRLPASYKFSLSVNTNEES